MFNILVVFSSQTGQMESIVHSLLQGIESKTTIEYHKIELEQPYPFPWKQYDVFFDAMPESVLGVSKKIKPLAFSEKKYDLVILGYQPWFLSPSIPFNSFLKSEFSSILKNTPVVTIIGCRNMWLRGQEIVKKQLLSLNSKLVGNIVLEDKHPNIASTMSIVRWMIEGQKEASKKYPEAGVSDQDVMEIKRMGSLILNSLSTNSLASLQTDLLHAGAINLHPNLIVMEGNGARQFPKWAKRAIEKDQQGRKKVLNNFKRLLFVAIFILSPISGTMAKLKTRLNRKKFERDIAYFKQIEFEPGRI